MSDEIPEPSQNDPKEVYAFYGLAMYSAQVLEHSLLNLAAGLYLTNSPVRSREIFDSTYEELTKKTLGALIRAARTLTTFAEGVDDVLDEALRKRNYLAHHFFREHADRFPHEEGQRQMLAELRRLIADLQAADELVTPIYRAVWKHFGVDDAWVEREVQNALREGAARYGSPLDTL